MESYVEGWIGPIDIELDQRFVVISLLDLQFAVGSHRTLSRFDGQAAGRKGLVGFEVDRDGTPGRYGNTGSCVSINDIGQSGYIRSRRYLSVRFVQEDQIAFRSRISDYPYVLERISRYRQFLIQFDRSGSFESSLTR